MAEPEEEYDGPITSAPASWSTANKQGSMKAHFKHFVLHHWVKQVQELTFHTFDELMEEDVTVTLVDNFVNYLCGHARHGCKKDGDPLKCGTADQYLSSFKGAVNFKFFKRRTNCYLVTKDDQAMGILRKAMLQKKRRLCRSDGVEITKSLETATDSDLDAFFQLCFWKGTNDSAEFLHLMMCCIANCGRGSEVRFYKFTLHLLYICHELVPFCELFSTLSEFVTNS